LAPSAEPTPNAVTDTGREPNDVRHAVHSTNAVPAANGIQHCPHCHQQLAVVAVIIPATAAHVRTPEVIHISPT
jgi:hypothetical protein